jgi:hypothetical protein
VRPGIVMDPILPDVQKIRTAAVSQETPSRTPAVERSIPAATQPARPALSAVER